MNKFHMHGLNRFVIAIALVCAMSVSTRGGVLGASASSIPSESKAQDQVTTQQKNETYNDIDNAWIYNGNWSESNVRRTVGGQIHVSNTVQDSATISISGSRFTFVYSTAPNYGALDVFVDDVKINTVNQKKSKPSHQKEWISPELGPGSHVIKLVHASGKLVSIDALRVRAPRPAPEPAPTDEPAMTDDPVMTEVPTLAAIDSPVPTEISVTMIASPISTIPVETSTPTFTPEVTWSPTPSETATLTVSPTPSPLPSATQTRDSIFTPTSTPSQPPSSEPSFTPTATFTASPAPSSLPTFTPTVTPTFTSTVTPTSAPTLVSTNIRYVSLDGNDSNPGTEMQPWRTINKAARTLIAGDTVYIRGGVYKESVFISNSGTSSQPIRFLAYPGEVPVIDGNNYQLPTSYWGVLLEISGNYVQVSGIEIRYSNWMGVVLSGDHDLASNMNVHHNRETGVLVSGDYGIVQNSRIWQNANRNEVNSPYSGGGWATGLSAARHPNNAILRGNTIYNNWGEGLSTFEANGTIMEDNIIYDNWSANVYISDATNVRLQRNLIYVSDNSLITSGSRVGIMMGDERYNPASRDITIINNLVYGAYRNFYWWQGNQGGGMVNVLVANNTFVNSRNTAGIQVDYGPHQNVRFFNNIIQQEDTLPVAVIDPVSGITFSHNLWSKKPSSIAAGSGDIIADPNLAKTGDYTLPEWYQLGASSPGRDNGLQIGGLIEDFFRKPRGEFPDIGAFEN